MQTDTSPPVLPIMFHHGRAHPDRPAGAVLVRRGVSYLPTQSPPAWQQREEANLARIIGCVTGSREAASHQSAAILHGAWIRESEPDVSVINSSSPTLRSVRLARIAYGDQRARSLRPGQSRTGNGIHAGREVRLQRWQRTFQADEITTALGINVTTVARTIMDCLLDLPGPDGFVTAEGVLVRAVAWDRRQAQASQQRSAAVTDAVTHLLKRYANRRGMRRARGMLPLLDAASESPGESETRYWLLRAGIPRPVCQAAVVTPNGPLFPDITLAGTTVCIEFDGAGKYHKDGEALYREKYRQDELTRLGWTVVRVVWADLHNPQQMIDRVLRTAPPGTRIPLIPREWMA